MKKVAQIKSGVKLISLIYLFILSIELIKKSSLFLAPNIKDFLLQNLGPIKAVCFGWFSTTVVQSSGAISTITATFAGNNLLQFSTAVYIVIGATIGTTITAIIISLVTVSTKRKDFRHGFEIGLCYTIYNAFLVVIAFLLEYFFHFFSNTSLFLASKISGKVSLLKIPDLVGIFTSPIINPLFKHSHNLFLLLFGFAILIFSLKYIGRAVIGIFGGEENARKFIDKHFKSKYKAYLIGALLTAILFSSSITIGLLVPLAVTRLIGLKRAIPFIIGADLGTFTDVFLAALVINQTPAMGIAIVYIMLAMLGSLIFLPNTKLLYKMTKYVSKKLIVISRKKALYILIAFILIPLLIILIF
jgi:solute carrier family 34 (sodium-dependent phosphate cotransporter)